MLEPAFSIDIYLIYLSGNELHLLMIESRYVSPNSSRSTVMTYYVVFVVLHEAIRTRTTY